MNRPLRRNDFGPYRPVAEGRRNRFFVMLDFADHTTAPPQSTDSDIASVFEAKENLRAVRSSLLRGGHIDPTSLALAERIVAGKKRGARPSDEQLDALANDLAKITD